MPISSIRLSESVRRAVKASDQSISELAREGIEQAIVGDYVSICWICGEAIHRDERRDYISTEVFIDDIANRDVDRSYQSRDYQTSVENIREYEQHNPLASDYYFERVLDWLNLPEPGFYPVEICGSCSEYIDKIRNQTIQASDIPIPYQYRTDNKYVFEDAGVAYAAEAAAVHVANRLSLLEELYNRKNESSEERQNAAFWWAARGRAERIIGQKSPPWVEISLRSHAHCLRAGKPLQNVFTEALETSEQIGQGYRPGRGDGPPPAPPTDPDMYENGDTCDACGIGTKHHGFEEEFAYCEECLASYCPCNHEPECNRFHPRLIGEKLSEENIELHCYNCGKSKPVPEKEAAYKKTYTEKIVEKYTPVWKEISTSLPLPK